MQRRGKEQDERKVQECIHDHLSEEFIGEWVKGDNEDMRIRWRSIKDSKAMDYVRTRYGSNCRSNEKDVTPPGLPCNPMCREPNCKYRQDQRHDYGKSDNEAI